MTQAINQKDSQGLQHGPWELYYTNGHLWSRGHYHHGVLHGIWESYYWDGTISWRRHWLHGKQHGLWEWYRSDGHLEKLELWYQDTQVPFFIELLLNSPILDI